MNMIILCGVIATNVHFPITHSDLICCIYKNIDQNSFESHVNV